MTVMGEESDDHEGERHSVVLVTIDCLRADYVSCLGFPDETTPTIDRLAGDGILFRQAISTGTSTPISFPGILASAYPQYNTCDHRWLPKDTPLISEILLREGYKTAAFHSAPFLSRYYSYDRGFTFFYDSLGDMRMSRIIRNERRRMILLKAKFLLSLFTFPSLPYKRAEIITDKSLKWLEKVEKGQHFFLWLHYMDIHPPYLPPKYDIEKSKVKELMRKLLKNREKITDKDLKLLLTLYKSEIMYVDSELNRFFEGLGEIYDDAYIIVTADHGEEFREHGMIGHALPRQKPYEELIHVPLIIRGPGLKRGLVVDRCVSLLEISPTILNLLNIRAESNILTKRRRYVISESYVLGTGDMYVSLRTSDWKFIFDLKNKSCELYNLRRDPREKDNLYEEEKDRAAVFRSIIKKHIVERQVGKERRIIGKMTENLRGRI